METEFTVRYGESLYSGIGHFRTASLREALEWVRGYVRESRIDSAWGIIAVERGDGIPKLVASYMNEGGKAICILDKTPDVEG